MCRKTNVAIDVRGVAKSFGDVRALDGFDMRVEAGEIHGLVGHNGAGKTTLLRVLFGLVAPDEGSITLLGEDISAAGGATVEGVGGFVEEPRFYPYLSARRNLGLLADLDGSDRDRVDAVLGLVGLEDRAGRKVGGFSSGTRQRLGLAAALLRSPRVLLLDEPTVGLDPSGVSEMLRLMKGLKEQRLTALISSHNMLELEGICDSVTVMKEGKSVWEGSMERLRAESPAPAYRFSTSDDAGALEIAGAHADVSVVRESDGSFRLHGEPEAVDEYVVSLGRAGVAVRRLELRMSALESMFFALTGVRPEALAADTEPERVGTAT